MLLLFSSVWSVGGKHFSVRLNWLQMAKLDSQIRLLFGFSLSEISGSTVCSSSALANPV